MRTAATQVINLSGAGHRRLAFVGGPASLRQVADRHEGATRAILRAGGTPSDLDVIETAALNVAGGQAAGRQLATLPASVRPTAVF